MASNLEIIGREDIDDIDAILAITNTDVDEVEHAVRANADAIFTWDYERSRPALGKLYEKAKKSQWNANDLPWEIDVDQEKVSREPEPERVQPRPRLVRHAVQGLGRQGVDRVRYPVAELDALAVHARRAGRAHLHRADRGDRALDRRQVLRRHPGDGRSPPRRRCSRATSTPSCRATTRSTRTSRCCSTTSSPTPAGT